MGKWEKVGALWRKKGFLSGVIEIGGSKERVIVVVNNYAKPGVNAPSHIVMRRRKEGEEERCRES